MGLGLGNSLIHAGYISGKYSNFSGSFDGTADFVLLPEVAALKPTAALSISLWAQPNAWDMTNGGNNDYFLGCVSSGGFGIYMANTGAQVTTIKGIIRVEDDGSGTHGYIRPEINEATVEALTGWHHIVMTFDGTTAKLYLDADGSTGVTNATGASGTTIRYHSSNARPIMLGADAATDTTASDFYHGLLDEVAIWNVALDQNDVTALFNSGTPITPTQNSGGYDKSSGLIGYWAFEEGSGTTVADDSTNSNNGGLGNAWSWSTDTPG